MSETITTYKLPFSTKPTPMKREEFYREQKRIFNKTGKPTKACEIVQILLFTPDKELILQKRSLEKNHNPGLIDKTIGGHVVFGFTPTYTTMSETLQELHVPSFVLDSKEDFKKTFHLLKNYLDRSALIQFIETDVDVFEKIMQKKVVKIANKFDFYFGFYNGPIKPADKEASGVLYYKWNALQKEMKVSPELFTYDLKYFLKRYKKKIESFLKIVDEK
ncbi:MAG: hypothetical protein WA019_03015 [Candidatus Moraniibacteriota bacterium]